MKDHESQRTGAGWSGRVRGLAERVSPHLQDVTSGWRDRAQQVRGGWHDRAEQRLEDLIEQRRRERGEQLPPEVGAALDVRRQEREKRARELRWRAEVLAEAQTAEERRVLQRVLGAPAEAGPAATNVAPRYTALLDTLAPGGEPEREMAVHRAIWSLAERRVLAVSPHGEVRVTFVSSGPEPLD